MEGTATSPHGLGAGGTCARGYLLNLCMKGEWFEVVGTSQEAKVDDSAKSDRDAPSNLVMDGITTEDGEGHVSDVFGTVGLGKRNRGFWR